MIEYGEKKFGWVKKGVLVSVPHLKFSKMLECAESGNEFVCAFVW
jgi:hypothetical protein